VFSSQDIYNKSTAIIQAADKEKSLKTLPTSIIALIAHNVPFQVFPDDDEKTIIARIKAEQTREIDLLAKSSSLKGIEGAIACKKLPDSHDVNILIKKNELIDQANLQMANKISKITEDKNGIDLEIKGNVLSAQLTRIPSGLIKELAERTSKAKAHLLSISVTHNKITSFPEELCQFDQVRYINFSKNELTELPSNFRHFKYLDQLYLDENQFSQFPSVVCELKELTLLSFNRSKFKFIPEKIGLLKNLTKFNLERCENLSTVPASIKYLNKLEILSITGNKFVNYSLSDELVSIFKKTYSYDNLGRGNNYSQFYYSFATPGFSPSVSFSDDFSKHQQLEILEADPSTKKPLSFILLRKEATQILATLPSIMISNTNIKPKTDNLGIEYYKNGEYKEAIKVFKNNVAQTKECDAPSLYNLASALMKLNSEASLIEARGYLVSACILMPSYKTYQTRLEECCSQLKTLLTQSPVNHSHALSSSKSGVASFGHFSGPSLSSSVPSSLDLDKESKKRRKPG
jgi:tetratricopeptide (TPR) repeat protein